MTDIVVVTEGGGDARDIRRGLVDAMDELGQPGVGALTAGGLTGGLGDPVDDSEGVTYIYKTTQPSEPTKG